MITKDDFHGVLALPPSPYRADADPFGPEHTLDLDEAARVADQLIRDGVTGIGLCGTTGECAALTWPEKRLLYTAVRDAVAGRVPLWGGATALSTREVVEQMRELVDLGLDGAFVGLPLWQTPTVQEAVQFYADLCTAVPQLPILVYGNSFVFKFDFPPEFWAGIAARCPTVVATKVTFPFTREAFQAAGHRVAFLHGEARLFSAAYRQIPESITAAWSTSSAMGPEPWVAAMNAISAGDHERTQAILNDIDSVPLSIPDMSEFAKYNVQFEKARIEAAGYMRCGLPRPPYTDLPSDWRAAAEANGRGWRELRASYTKQSAATSPAGGTS